MHLAEIKKNNLESKQLNYIYMVKFNFICATWNFDLFCPKYRELPPWDKQPNSLKTKLCKYAFFGLEMISRVSSTYREKK